MWTGQTNYISGPKKGEKPRHKLLKMQSSPKHLTKPKSQRVVRIIEKKSPLQRATELVV